MKHLRISIENLPPLSCMSEDTAREWTKAPEGSTLGPPETALELPAAVLGYGGVPGRVMTCLARSEGSLRTGVGGATFFCSGRPTPHWGL